MGAFENTVRDALTRRGLAEEAVAKLMQRACDELFVADRLAELLATQTASFVVDGATWTVLPPIKVVYEEDKRAMFEKLAAGCHDPNCRNMDANVEHFPIGESDHDEYEPILVHFGKKMGDEAVLAYADKHELEDSRSEPTLTVGNKHPELQKEFPIVATAHEGSRSVWVYADGNRYVLVLSSDGERRILGVRWGGRGWGGLCRFLFLRKVAKRV